MATTAQLELVTSILDERGVRFSQEFILSPGSPGVEGAPVYAAECCDPCNVVTRSATVKRKHSQQHPTAIWTRVM